jgi:hypothetical protein
MSSYDGAGQVVRAGAASLAGVALTVRLSIVSAAAGGHGALTTWAADPVGPTVLPDQLEERFSGFSEGMGGTGNRAGPNLKRSSLRPLYQPDHPEIR